MWVRGGLNQTSYLASLRGEAAATRGEGKWRDGGEFMIDAFKYLIYIYATINSKYVYV